MKAEIAVGIIAWSFFLTVPFICRQVYRENFQNPVIEQKEGALEQKVADDAVKIKLPWKKHSGVVDCCMKQRICAGLLVFQGRSKIL